MTLTTIQLAEHLKLQNELNALVNPNWLDADNKWTDAMMVEAVELLDHYGWKWWKAQKSDMAQARIELVDIWHFILSYALEKADGDQHIANASLGVDVEHPQFSVFVGYHTQNLATMDTRALIRTFVSLAAGGIVSVTAFTCLMQHFELDWSELHRMYVAKNVLNIFRQQNGYKDGTYVKVWHGKEDNEVLQGLIDARPDATVDQLFAKLEHIYTNLPKETA